MNHKRTRYQHGSLTTETRKKGPAIWIYRWRESFSDGTVINRKKIVGTTEEFASKAAALRAVDGLRLEINSTSLGGPTNHTVAELISHYCEVELTEESAKTARTREVYLHHLKKVILPTWGSHELHQVRAVAVERWLGLRTAAPATKAKTRNIFSTLFRHAIRHEWTTANPIQYVRQSAQRLHEPPVLTLEELQALIGHLNGAPKVFAMTAAVTGLRRGEIVGLKWQDIDFDHSEIRVVRSLVDNVEGKPKTEASKRPVPLSPEHAALLQEWLKQTAYSHPHDWVFASAASFGANPLWPGMLLTRHIQRAAREIGITKVVGWHTFRRTYATLLPSTGASVATTRDLMRHQNASLTFSLYAQAVTEEKRATQNALASLISGKLRAA